MIRRLALRRQAQLDVQRSRSWYESERQGLGDEFIDAVDDVLSAVGARPEAYEVVDVTRGVRRALTRKFPFVLYFVVEPDRVVVLAILHAARNPEVWRSRP